ncbi:hypothetical protein R1flu_021756 [Riccia fluitans]|uniref:non-specific serine/threonine protein kinase n=1 Tax=Riccia fluitans TaxID=41844 RepID=A0ABD1ZQH8_9MARC
MWRRRGMAAAKLLFVVILCCQLLQRGAAQTGFTSIDCGSTFKYTDGLGIQWVGDASYASTGETAAIDIQEAKLGADGVNDKRKLQTLRYLPGPANKHCYDIPFVASQKYLIRLTFLGGNLTSKAGIVDFSVSLGNAYWQNIQVSDPWTPIVREASFIPLQVSSPICFKRGDIGDPFVNSIEIRPLPLLAYQVTFNGLIYTNVYRLDCGLKAGSPSIRYPDDPSDRIWAADIKNFSIPAVVNANARLESTIPDLTFNQPPVAVLRSAWNASSISFQLPMSTFPKSPIDSGLYFISFYFVEIAGTAANDFRVVDVNVDGSPLDDSPITLTSRETRVSWTIPEEGSQSANISITPSSNSSIPVALLNAVEVDQIQAYNVTMTTSAIGVKTIEALKTELNLNEWQGDPCLAWPYDWLKCSNPLNSGSNTIEIIALTLSNFNLSGTIPADISDLLELTELALDQNNFNGKIPDLSTLTKLKYLRLQNNNLSGPVPNFLGSLQLSVLTLDNNQLEGDLLEVGGLAVLLLPLFFIYWKFLRKPAQRPVTATGGGERSGSSSSLKPFSWTEVETMTKNFSKVLGKGGYGEVYYGELLAGKKVAVKVSLLSRVHHKHLVPFVGFCNEGKHEILIYDYMAQGTLEDHLKGERNTNNGLLDWKTRLDIVLNASKGIEYLHKSCNPPIIHRDIKTANILLNEHLVAKVSDFGISKPTSDENRTRGITTEVKGTFGYLDPEFFRGYRVTEKNDVYSFGVVLLEVITGKPPTTVSFPNSRASNLLEWVQSSIQNGNIRTIMDPTMGSSYNEEAVWKVTELALSCLRPNMSDRPDMTRVLQELMEVMERENHQTTVNVYPSPSNLPLSAFDHYQRVSEAPRVGRNPSRGDSSRRSSQDSITTFSTDNIQVDLLGFSIK